MPDNEAAQQLAYRKGRTAREHGKSIQANPYESDTSYFLYWRKGWEDEAAQDKLPRKGPHA